MSRRDALLRRIDLAARAALLAAGLLAQWALWTVGHSRMYPVAAVVLIAISIDSARRRFVSSTRAGQGKAKELSPRSRAICRVLGCVLVVEICVGVVGGLQSGDVVSMALPVGVLLLTLQAAHAFAVESRRDAKLGVVIVVAMLVAAGAFASTSTLAAPMVATMLAVLAAAALLQRGTILARMHDVVRAPRAPVLRAVVAPASTAVAIGALVFLALPNSTQLGTSTEFRYGTAGAVDFQSRATSDPGATTLDLRLRGALSDDAVFAVSVTAPSYWQGEILDTFDGTTWTATSGVSSAPAAASDLPTRADAVRVLSSRAFDVVFAPGPVVAYDGPGRVATDADGTSRLTGAGVAAPWTYEVTSQTTSPSAATLRSATGSDPADPKWTAVEAGLPARVRVLARQLTGSATTRYDAVNAVDSYLRAHETYDLNSSVPAIGVDAVDDFLFVSHRGFCEQFATAAVVMLRSLGIPARLVTGYSHGDLTATAGERVMRGVDAHAWVQVWYRGTGWIASDPTATSALPTAATAKTAKTANTQGAATVTPAPGPTTRRATPLTSAMHAMPGGRVGWMVMIVVLVAGAAATRATRATRAIRAMRAMRGGRGRRWTRAPRSVADPRRPGDGPALQAYLRLEAALGSSEPGEPAETLREVARRLGGPILARAEVVAALDCLERECYAVRPPADSDVLVAVNVFDRLRDLVGAQSVGAVHNLIPR